ncbi:transcription termination/antitermination NusG family protein [Yokenella regensburgei]|uniref:transcription termination/antitermination NusG family protein n=1 Tax=Yokenella regensburgei TaxID=158877 RepID=UPI0014330349|nr:transcription termination/antitermination NusG family protein [Yokenella regensburgei]QIU90112.1 hypothetical protein HEC60_12730 [Yokenella regensburgei]
MKTVYSWYLACHKRGKRNLLRAQVALEFMGVVSFSPLKCDRKPRGDRQGQYRLSMESLFPGYFFINFNPSRQQIKDIESVPGFSHLVKFGVELKPLRDEVITQIMQLPNCSLGPGVAIKPFSQELTEITSVEDEGERITRFLNFAIV